jgi:hypothetical protein
LSEGGKDDNDEFQSVHALPSNDIGKSTKSELTNNGSATGGNLDGGIRVGRHGALLGPVDYAQHGGEQTDGENVVGVSEESNACDNTSSDMVPAKA